jgi:hypothetical protein
VKDASAMELIRIGAWTTVGALAVYLIPGLLATVFMPRKDPKVINVAAKTPCGCGGH